MPVGSQAVINNDKFIDGWSQLIACISPSAHVIVQ